MVQLMVKYASYADGIVDQVDALDVLGIRSELGAEFDGFLT